MTRRGEVERKTKETEIRVLLGLEGKGACSVDTGIPFMDHMLSFLPGHGFVDLEISARGDTEIDDHHTVEDLGICLGMAIRKALGSMEGIRRYGEATVPMDESLARVVVDISNRSFLAYRVNLKDRRTGAFDVGLVREFFRALALHAGMTIHIDLITGEDPHHASEAIFKAFARALDQAVRLDDRRGGVPSTKGVL